MAILFRQEIPATEDAPPGSSGAIAGGVVIGLVLGIFLLSMAVVGLD